METRHATKKPLGQQRNQRMPENVLRRMEIKNTTFQNLWRQQK